MKKITCIVGTRPQLIKHAVLLPELEMYFDVCSINTHQHYDSELNTLVQETLYKKDPFITIPLKKNLDNAERLGEMIVAISRQLKVQKPDAVLVYGDTDSTLAGALAAHKNTLTLIHIEAGERSYNLNMPEENNRIITDLFSSILFCSSEQAQKNLSGYLHQKKIFCYGDLMKDLAQKTTLSLSKTLIDPPYYFCTIHRNYNQTDPKKIKWLLEIIQQTGIKTIFPLHPFTKINLEQAEIRLDKYPFIKFLPPISYSQSIHYQKFAEAIITDSGGIQKEAYWLKRPCITIRKETEWTDTLEGGWNQLLYEDLSQLPALLKKTPDKSLYRNELYGDGNASGNIALKLASLI